MSVILFFDNLRDLKELTFFLIIASSAFSLRSSYSALLKSPISLDLFFMESYEFWCLTDSFNWPKRFVVDYSLELLTLFLQDLIGVNFSTTVGVSWLLFKLLYLSVLTSLIFRGFGPLARFERTLFCPNSKLFSLFILLRVFPMVS